jgi:Fe-S cluster biogenesis protein NfuA
MLLLGDVGHVESRSVHLETVLVSVQGTCTVCAKHNIATEIVLDTPNGIPR